MTDGPIAQLHDAVDALLGADLDALDEAGLLEFTRAFEAGKRRLDAVDHALTNELERRGTAHSHNCANTATLLGRVLRLSISESRGRVRAAEALGERRALTGEHLEPRFAVVAAAQREGEISARHAAEITRTIDKLPPSVDEGDAVPRIECQLVEHARRFTPDELAKITRRLLDTYDPDGTLSDTDYRDRHRELTVHQRADGSVVGRFDGTAEFGEVLLSVLDVAGAPDPAADGTRDLRSPSQRNHDGLLGALRRVLRSGELSTSNGVVASVVLTMTAEQWTSGAGLARTGHGALVTVTDAKQMAGGEARLFPVVFEDGPQVEGIFRTARPIAAYGTAQRIFTEGQRLAMIARDGGCTFPACTVPALWCEADHVVPWLTTRRTSVDDGHLVCPHHHREKDRQGWQVSMREGVPHWTAPAWIDPTQTPQRNHAHDPTVFAT